MTSTEQETLFRQWLAAHEALLWRVIRSFAATQADQQDLLQDILLQMWRSIPTFRGDAKESTWIYRLAFNTALAWQRSEKRRHSKHEAFTTFMDAHGSASTSDDALIERLYTAIRALPKLDASLALMHLDGLSYREMGDVLGMTENHIGVRLTRLRKQLTEQMKGQNHDL
jgi:RNA polymerase sigma-70 factor (ECF subfamily)